MADDVKRLYRSRSQRWLFGVCGGFGKYFNLDPILVRALFVILALIGGGGLLVYLVLVIIIPLEPEGPATDSASTAVEKESPQQ